MKEPNFELSVDMDGLDGPALHLPNGRRFSLLDPNPGEIDVQYIAYVTANLPKFSGLGEFYSIAQHGLLVSQILSPMGPEFALWGLFRDATDAYTRVSRVLRNGFKETLEFIERVLLEAVAIRFGLDWPIPPEITWGVNAAQAIEDRDLMGVPFDWPIPGREPPKIEPLGPQAAQEAFLDWFEALGGRERSVLVSRPPDGERRLFVLSPPPRLTFAVSELQ
jgi:hypothetical protein